MKDNTLPFKAFMMKEKIELGLKSAFYLTVLSILTRLVVLFMIKPDSIFGFHDSGNFYIEPYYTFNIMCFGSAIWAFIEVIRICILNRRYKRLNTQ